MLKRVVLKLTGESLAGKQGFGVDPQALDALAEKVISACNTGAEIAVVVGGGNFIRGSQLSGQNLIRPRTAHQMGMTSTIINGLALSEALLAKGASTSLTCVMPAGNFTEYYNPQKAQTDLHNKKVVILTGGTGNAFVTTDTCAAIRAAELQADAVLKATKVDGVYAKDPVKYADAKKYDKLTYDQVINDRLGVMDLAAVEICKQANIPIIVFNFQTPENIDKVIKGQQVGTTIS